jgi:hypothetical protein
VADLVLVRSMRIRNRYIAPVIALLVQAAVAQNPSDLIHITSIGGGGGLKSIGGYAIIPANAQPELCHLSLDNLGRGSCQWFGEAGCRKIRFEVTLPVDEFTAAVLTLSDHPLSIKSVEELQSRPGSTFAQIKVNDVIFPGK